MSTTVRTQAELAEALGVTDRTIRHYLARKMPGADSRGRYNVERCRAWVSANIREREELDVSELKEALARAELRKTEAQAAKIELENRIKSGNLWEKDDVLQQVNEMVLMLKTRMESYPEEMEMEVPLEIRSIAKTSMQNRVYLWLKELEAMAPREPPSEEDSE